MVVSGLDMDSRIYFASATVVIATPTAVKMFNWLLSLVGIVGMVTNQGCIIMFFW